MQVKSNTPRFAFFNQLMGLFLVFYLLPLSILAQNFCSPADLDFVDNGEKILVTDRTGQRLLLFDTHTEKIIQTIKFKHEPTGAVVSADGKKYYVTAGTGPGHLLIVDPSSGKIVKSLSAGHGMNSPVISKDGNKLYVCSRFDHSVKVIDLNRKKLSGSIPVSREPVASEMTPDGKWLYVANHLPRGRSDTDFVASEISVIDLENEQTIKTIKLVNGATGVRGIDVSSDGKFIYATHLVARFRVPTTQVEQGWMNTNALSVISVTDQKLVYTVLLDDPDLGFSNPWAVKTSGDGKLLCITSAGNHEIRMIDLPAMTAKIDRSTGQAALDKSYLDMHNDLSFISTVSKRIRLKGKGPGALLMGQDNIYVAEYFSESLGKLTMDEHGNVEEVLTIPLVDPTPMTKERLGEALFNDASLCFQHWQSCASCHSNDGRTDGLNWDLLNDGVGNSKNTKSLLLSHRTPPTMGLGVRADAETAVRSGIKYILFSVQPEKNAEAIDAYLKSLSPVPAPGLIKGKLSKAAKRGKKVFEEAGCSNCHPAPLFTDMKSYDLGTGKGPDEGKKFDTPTLIETWRTSPYWHDGRAESITEAINLHYLNSAYKLDITEKELNDLKEYIESL